MDGREAAGSLPPEVASRIVDTAVNPFCLIEVDGTIRWVGPGITEILGTSPDMVVGRSVLDLLTPTDGQRVAETLASLDRRIRDGAPSTWEGGAPIVDLRRLDGALVRVRLSVATPARTGLDCHVVQIRRAGGENALHEALASMAADDDLDTVLSHLLEMADMDLPWVRVVVAWDWDGERFHRSLGGIPSLDLTQPMPAGPWRTLDPRGHLLTTDDLPDVLGVPARELGVGDVWVHPLRIDEQPATIIAWHLATWSITSFTVAALDRLARLVRVALLWDDSRRALAVAATHDQLTGLRNRRSFLAELGSAARNRATVLYLDLDDFKPVNDDLGHAVGDAVLTVVSARLRSSVRPSDVVARLGGDEFAVLCPGLDELGGAALADRLVEEVSRPISIAGRTVTVGLTIGIAATNGGNVDPDQLLHRADVALRQAKAAGKGRWLAAATD